MFMTNIPRRKIYEEMLKYEDIIIEMQILIYSEENFKKFKDKFKDKYQELEKIYLSILALFVMFLENKKYPLGNEFEKDLDKLNKDKIKVKQTLEKNKNLPKEFFTICKNIEENFKKQDSLQTLEKSKQTYKELDKFNHLIPEILTIRRDEMK